MINIQALLQAYTRLIQNPNQVLASMNIPEQYRGNPNDAIQYLMNNGKVSQQMYNNANNQLKQLQSNPLFKQFFNK
jgi:hypothetical protein